MIQDWFLDAKLGIFIHWGIYSVADVSESWSFHNGAISYEDYMKQCEGFTAEHFDANAWAQLFKRAGARYAVLTSKHHDGVCLFDTAETDLSVVKCCPAGRDLIREYSSAMQAAELRCGLYFSLIDWSDPRYRSVYPAGVSPDDSRADIYGSPAGGPEDPQAFEAFLASNRSQMRELLTNYGTIDLLWFDGDWERSAEQWKMAEFRDYLHRLNPAIVLNSRMQGYGDYATPEQGLPLEASGPFEFCTTMNQSWGYRPSDDDYKSPAMLVRMFCDCISLGGNMLLDIGPKPDGTIDAPQVERLEAMGDFVHANSEAIYASRRGLDRIHYGEGSTLSKDGRNLYLFVFDSPAEMVCVRGLASAIDSITVLRTGERLNYQFTGAVPWQGIQGTLWIEAKGLTIEDHCTVIKIALAEPIKIHHGHGSAITYNP
ncbi:MAG: alpha-L-fucosidase [Eubacteriales bacterium]|nr:alpha-L-fucosidase [Eubacteriales bacterium]